MLANKTAPETCRARLSSTASSLLIPRKCCHSFDHVYIHTWHALCLFEFISNNGRNTTQLLLTKGDNNDLDDVGLYRGPEWLDSKYVVGKVQG